MQKLENLPVLILAYNRFEKFNRCIKRLNEQGIKKIYLAGFDGFKKDDPYTDTTQKMINILIKKSNINDIKSLTKTDYKLK